MCVHLLAQQRCTCWARNCNMQHATGSDEVDLLIQPHEVYMLRYEHEIDLNTLPIAI